jgi:hypothetical protein
MAQIDFAVAFVVIFMMVSYSVFFVSNTLAKDFDYFNEKELEESSDSMSDQLFYTMDNKSLVYDFKKMQILFEEIGGYQHTESITISIGLVGKAHVYNLTMGEVQSSYASGNISFDLEFLENEKKYVSIIYDGNAENVTYVGGGNVTAKILYEDIVSVLSQDRCGLLKSLPYNESKNIFGMSHNFRIDNHCVYGENPPTDADIIVKSVPVIIENQDGTVYPDYVTLKVW